MARVILDDVADTTSVDFEVSDKGATVWVTAGTADLKLDGDVIVSLVEGTPQVIDGNVAGETLTLLATSANTTAKVSG